VNDRELNTDSPSPLESLVRPEERATSDVPQDISQDAILARLRHAAMQLDCNLTLNYREKWELLVMMVCIASEKVAKKEAQHSRTDASSIHPG